MFKLLAPVLAAMAGAMIFGSPSQAADPAPVLSFHETCAYTEIRVQTTTDVALIYGETIATGQRFVVDGSWFTPSYSAAFEAKVLSLAGEVLVPVTGYTRQAPISCSLPDEVRTVPMCQDGGLAVTIVNGDHVPTVALSVFKGTQLVEAGVVLPPKSVRHFALTGMTDETLFVTYGEGNDRWWRIRYVAPDNCADRRGPVGQPLPVPRATFTDTCTGVRVVTEPDSPSIGARIYETSVPIQQRGYPSGGSTGAVPTVRWESPADITMQQGELAILRIVFTGDSEGGLGDSAEVASHVHKRPANCSSGGALPRTGTRTALTLTAGGAGLVTLGVIAFLIGRRRFAAR